MSQQRFHTATVIGTGMMGPGIAVSLARGGLRVTLLSRREDSAQAGLEKARSQLALLAEHGLIDPARAGAAREKLGCSWDFDHAIQGADLVVESAVEEMRFKQDLFGRMDAIAGPEKLLASNTSGLSITEIAAGCRHPERVLTTHFWNPPHLMPLVEIIRGERTDPEAATAVAGLLRECGKMPVVVKKDRPGQLGNRLQMALVREALHIVAEGIADPEDVDIAAKCGFGMRLPVYGILEHQDMVGFDLGMAVLDYVSRDLSNEQGIPGFVREKMKRGEVGVKAGRGFYDWSKKDAEAVRTRRDRFLLEFLKAGY